jgi:hypothetical protein
MKYKPISTYIIPKAADSTPVLSRDLDEGQTFRLRACINAVEEGKRLRLILFFRWYQEPQPLELYNDATSTDAFESFAIVSTRDWSIYLSCFFHQSITIPTTRRQDCRGILSSDTCSRLGCWFAGVL